MAAADLVVFGEDWGRHPSSTQHLIMRLKERRRVLWINSIGLRRPRLSVRDARRLIDKAVAIACRKSHSGSAPAPNGINVVSPLALSWPGSRAAYGANRLLLKRQIGRAADRMGFKRPILWTSLPTALPVVGQLNEHASVYYCGDDFAALAGVDHEPVAEMEHRLVGKADLVIAASERLAARFPRSKTLLVPHGADVALFKEPTARASDLPAGRPIAGFYGSLADWIDVELLCAVADRMPDWLFVFIGRCETDVSALAARNNVRFLGPRAHCDLPAYSQHWTASMLPFRDCAQIAACNPLKLREYLAAGRPIVSTPFPALSGYLDCVSVVTAADSFEQALRRSVSDKGGLARQRRVAEETWESRASMVERALEQL